MVEEEVHGEERVGNGSAGEEATTAGRASAGEEKKDLSWHLERIWREIKELTRQVEAETRRGGRIARLRFEIRGLRQDVEQQEARLGRLVYDAQMAGGRRPTLSRVEGYDEAVERIADLEAQVEAKEERIAELRRQGEPDPEA